MARSFLPSLFGSDRTQAPSFQSLQKEIDRVFEDFRHMRPQFDFGELTEAGGRIVPRLDISEADDKVEISAELPGVKEDDIDVSVSGNTLTLRGEKSASRDEEKKDFRLVERSYGSFSRSVPLNFDINPDDVSATFSDGVLTIAIAKPQEVVAKTRKIEVKKAD